MACPLASFGSPWEKVQQEGELENWVLSTKLWVEPGGVAEVDLVQEWPKIHDCAQDSAKSFWTWPSSSVGAQQSEDCNQVVLRGHEERPRKKRTCCVSHWQGLPAWSKDAAKMATNEVLCQDGH